MTPVLRPSRTTDRLELPVPGDESPPDYVTATSAIADIIDPLAAIDTQGTLEARPVAGVRGRYYFATDQNAVYRDTGTTWQIIGGPAPTVGCTATWSAGTEVDIPWSNSGYLFPPLSMASTTPDFAISAGTVVATRPVVITVLARAKISITNLGQTGWVKTFISVGTALALGDITDGRICFPASEVDVSLITQPANLNTGEAVRVGFTMQTTYGLNMGGNLRVWGNPR